MNYFHFSPLYVRILTVRKKGDVREEERIQVNNYIRKQM
jgi:hypothetical protein